jgi:hypothetical protein
MFSPESTKLLILTSMMVRSAVLSFWLTVQYCLRRSTLRCRSCNFEHLDIISGDDKWMGHEMDAREEGKGEGGKREGGKREGGKREGENGAEKKRRAAIMREGGGGSQPAAAAWPHPSLPPSPSFPSPVQTPSPSRVAPCHQSCPWLPQADPAGSQPPLEAWISGPPSPPFASQSDPAGSKPPLAAFLRPLLALLPSPSPLPPPACP